MDDRVELLVTVVVAAETDQAARAACRDLVWQVDGRVVETADCSAEEPGCWSVTMRVPTEERATHNLAAPLARAVRVFIRGLGPDVTVPRVSCEPPTAWTVLDDPDLVTSLVSGAERLLVEAWHGDDPYPGGETPAVAPETQQDGALDDRALDDDAFSDDALSDGDDVPAAEPDSPEPPVVSQTWVPPEEADGQGCRLTLRVDVATSRAAGAEWQARALASRISRNATLTGITERDGVLSVLVDLGTVRTPPPQTVLTAVSALDRPGWSALRWEGEKALTTWTARPRPVSGIIELELSSSPDVRRHRG
ncbi:MAG TPA: hypothetical protein VHF06_02795 [Pseudonocardiaceae bacterium]|jgi:hypothetical protein|nr:hypothetical protein [Pseudonocardiaceae bacterium]